MLLVFKDEYLMLSSRLCVAKRYI